MVCACYITRNVSGRKHHKARQRNLWFSGILSSAKMMHILALSMKALSTLKSHANECVNPKGNNCYISPHSFKFLKGVIHHELWPKKVQLQHFSEGLVSKSLFPNLGALLSVILQSAVLKPHLTQFWAYNVLFLIILIF